MVSKKIKSKIFGFMIYASYTCCSVGFLSIIHSSHQGCYKFVLNKEFRNFE